VNWFSVSSSGRHLVATAAVLLCLSPAPSLAQVEQGFDFTSCHAGVLKVLYDDKDVALRTAEGWGIVMSNRRDKLLDGATFHVVTTIRTIGKESTEVGFYKLMDSDGDVILAEVSRSGEEHVARYFHGTGKWRGIRGSGRSERVASGVGRCCRPARARAGRGATARNGAGSGTGCPDSGRESSS